ncbi:MAG: hypothetical protein MJ164_00645 [Alphaproteobacteria bacterium]|nr:hypothetical protein [Alphaproteobacteria bacterium]
MAQNFIDATNMLKIINANKQLTNDTYSEQNADILAQTIWDTIKPYINDNLSVYQQWDKQNYSRRKKFVSDILKLLLEKFPNDNKTIPQPQIHFQEEIKPIWPKNIPMPSALFYSPELNPWANDMVKKATGSTKPFFAFFHDLSAHGVLGQIIHEFTHYLQSIGKSSLSPDVVKQAAEYYKYYYADKNNKQIYEDSVHEKEAREVSKYITAQVKQLCMFYNNMLHQPSHDI